MFRLFARKAPRRPVVVVRLNARLQPLDRGAAFGDAVDVWLTEIGFGEVTGGGTAFTPGEGVSSCDLEIEADAVTPEFLAALAEKLDALGAPVGSKLILDNGGEIPIGVVEGLAVHVNGTDLPDTVYESCSLEDLRALLDAALSGRGRVLSDHHGATESSLYLYGDSAAQMQTAIADVLASYPLCERARLEKIA